MSVPQDIASLSSSLKFEPNQVIDLDVEAFSIIAKYGKKLTTNAEEYRKIVAMNKYIGEKYNTLPLASINYINAFKARYAYVMAEIMNVLQQFIIVPGAVYPNSVSNLVRIVGQNNSLNYARLQSFIDVIKQNEFPGSDPLPNFEK